MRRSLLALLLASAALLARARGASAEPPAISSPAMPERILLRRSGCSPLALDEEALASRLRVELAETRVRSIDIAIDIDINTGKEGPREAASSQGATVTLLGACSGGELTIVIHERGQPSATRSIDVGEMARAVRERSLALAIAELLRSRASDRAELTAETERAAPPEPERSAPARSREPRPLAPAPPAPAPPPDSNIAGILSARPRERRGAPALVSAGVEWRFLLEHNTTLTGGRLAVSLPAGSSFIARFSAEGGASYDSENDGSDAIELWLVTGGLGVSGGYRWEAAEIGLGPRLELGFGHASAAPSSAPGQVLRESAPVAIASMVATGRARLGPRLWLSMDLEIGHVLRGFDARSFDRGPTGISGATGGFRLGAAVGL